MTGLRRRYAYARVSVKVGEVEVVAGVEMRDAWGDGVPTLPELYWQVRETVVRVATVMAGCPDDQIAYHVESHLRERFGADRSYFIEVGRGALDEYVQVFQE
jgi:hypothetical protein